MIRGYPLTSMLVRGVPFEGGATDLATFKGNNSDD